MNNNKADPTYYKHCVLCDKEFVYEEGVIYKDQITRDIVKCPFCHGMLTADRVDVTKMVLKYL